MGDFSNWWPDASGMARLTFSASDLAVGSGATNVIGRAVIVHGGVDDFKSQPARAIRGLACLRSDQRPLIVRETAESHDAPLAGR